MGVRAYSTTMGLWARAALEEEFGVRAGDVTWVTTEEPHVVEAVEPANVVRTDGSLTDELKSGALTAAILSAKENPDLEPLIPDPFAAARGWYERHRCVPINHLVAVTRTLVDDAPDFVAAVYAALVSGIDEAGPPVTACNSVPLEKTSSTLV